MSVIKGSPVSQAICEQVSLKAEALAKRGVEPCLAILRVGNDGSQMAYEKNAEKRMIANGIKCVKVTLDEGVSQNDFVNEFDKLNEDDKVHGILVLQPLPEGLSVEPLKSRINPLKDVDAISPVNLYKVMAGDKSGYAPCTAEGVMEIVDWLKMDCKGKKCVVVGCSLVVGRPLGLLFLGRDATVTFCHEFTKDTAKEARDADILVSAAGVRKLIGVNHVNPDMTVIDVGINFDENGKMCGDVDFDAVEPLVKNITPVPGGVGAVTTSVLAKHVIKAAEALSE